MKQLSSCYKHFHLSLIDCLGLAVQFFCLGERVAPVWRQSPIKLLADMIVIITRDCCHDFIVSTQEESLATGALSSAQDDQSISSSSAYIRCKYVSYKPAEL